MSTDVIAVPSINDPAFISAYESAYGSLYRRVLRNMNYPCSPDLAPGEAGPLSYYLSVRSLKRRTFVFGGDVPCPTNPLLAKCPSVQQLIAHWLHDSNRCYFASNGLMYPTTDTLARFGPGGFPANSMIAEHALLLRRTEQPPHFILRESDDEVPELSDLLRVIAPTHLFRGQRGRYTPLAPFVRPLVDQSPEESTRREQTKFFVNTWLLRNARSSLLATVDYAIELASVLCDQIPAQITNTLLPTPYNLLWQLAPWDLDATIRLCEDVFDYSISLTTATWGSMAEMAIFVSHMTDYAYPVPVHAAVQFVTDFIPNPLVSTTTDIMRALLYASGYFHDFGDKFDVDWDIVEACLHSGTGYVLLIHIPPHGRKVVPISTIAQQLPPPYRSIGGLESEYGIPASIRPSEIIRWKEASEVLRLLKRSGIWSELRRQPDAVKPDHIAQVVFTP